MKIIKTINGYRIIGTEQSSYFTKNNKLPANILMVDKGKYYKNKKPAFASTIFIKDINGLSSDRLKYTVVDLTQTPKVREVDKENTSKQDEDYIFLLEVHDDYTETNKEDFNNAYNS